MKTRSIRGLTLYFDAGDEEAAGLIADACERSLDLLRARWGLEAPEDCRVYVMTSWPRFLFGSAPWPRRIYLAVTLPLRYGRIQKLWDLSGGWAQRYGRRQVMGLKPPRLLQEIDAGRRESVFVRRDTGQWVQHNTCHELVHACTEPLRLPVWLHEGLAMVAVDRLAGSPTVKAETLAALANRSRGAGPQAGSGRPAADPETLVYLAVRGYWIARYLDETRPALLKSQLARPQPHQALESALAAGLGLGREEFDARIDGIVLAHFRDGAC
jgi:hypothetical protein